MDEMRTKISLNVLKAVIQEFQAVGKGGREIRQIMEDELILAAHLYQLRPIQQHLLWWELGLYTSAFLEWIDDGVESGAQSNSSAATNGGDGPKRSKAIKEFMDKVEDATGRKINKTEIWTAAGYGDPTEFQKWQRNDLSNATAFRTFERILSMQPEDFLTLLDKKLAALDKKLAR